MKHFFSLALLMVTYQWLLPTMHKSPSLLALFVSCEKIIIHTYVKKMNILLITLGALKGVVDTKCRSLLF